MGKMPRNKARTRQRTVSHGAQQHAAGPRDRALTGAQAGCYFTGTHALEANGLILNHHIQQQVLLGTKIAHGCAHQVARLSAFKAIRNRSGKPSSSSAGTALCKSRSSKRTCWTWLSRRRPISVGVGGVARTSTGWPIRPQAI